MDKNGKLVTKHIRAGGNDAKKKLTAPAPTVSGASSAPKLTAGQTSQKELSFRAFEVGMDTGYALGNVFCNASEAEFYEVVSVISSHEVAVQAMIRGRCRTTEEAEEYLRQVGSDALGDRSLLVQEALRRRIKPQAFVGAYSWFHGRGHEMSRLGFDESTPEGVSRILDTVEFMATPLNASSNGFLWSNILKGDISYDDIKYLGVSDLKSYNRLHAISGVLVRLQRGEANYDLDDVKTLVQRDVAESKEASKNKISRDGRTLEIAAEALLNKGAGFLNRVESLESIERQHYNYIGSAGRVYDGDIWDRIEYAVLFDQERTLSSRPSQIDDFYEAGIPFDIGAQVLDAGGGVLEAKAIHEEGINKSVAGGWL